MANTASQQTAIAKEVCLTNFLTSENNRSNRLTFSAFFSVLVVRVAQVKPVVLNFFPWQASWAVPGPPWAGW